jgi:PiT family inorganic phosphate transporter
MADLTIPLGTLVLLVALALAFDFMNGFHDAANRRWGSSGCC